MRVERGRLEAQIGLLIAGGALALGSSRALAQGSSSQGTPAPEPPPSARIYLRSAAPAGTQVPSPDGWLGIHYICEIETWGKNGELFVRHSGYPLVAAVEPGSPAYRAGIEAGDTIIAYNNEDLVGRTFSLTKLLKPGSKLKVTIHRSSESLDIPVVVARRVRYAPDVVTIAPRVSIEIDSVTGLARRMVIRSGGTPRSMPTFVVAEPATPVPATAPMPTLPATSPVLAWSTTTALAGAELARVTPELGESFGVKSGVLVLTVGANTPASRAGLRGGDVITRVDGREVAMPLQFQRALQAASDEGVRLTVIRKRKAMEIEMRW